MKKSDKGPEVKELQEALLHLGYALPRWGADSDYGDETIRAVEQCFTDHGKVLSDKGSLTDSQVEWILGLVKPVEFPTGLVDLRSKHAGIHRYGKRDWKNVTGITLHQTACNLGNTPMRWKDVGCHMGITRNGQIIYLSDFTWLVVHGHGLNTYDVGIEMDGYYEGIEGNPKTLWQPSDGPTRKPMTPTPELVKAAQDACRYIINEVAWHGGKVKYIHAHRQASNTRQSDPGSALWKSVGLAMMKEFKLTDGGPGFVLGNGLPIPEAWDSRYVGVKY